MSLSTSSWDYIFTAHSKSAKNAFNEDVLFKNLRIFTDDVIDLTITNSKVDFDSNAFVDNGQGQGDPEDFKISITVTCKGTYKEKLSTGWSQEEKFMDLKLEYKILLKWLNSNNSIYTATDVELSVIQGSLVTAPAVAISLATSFDSISYFFNVHHTITPTFNTLSSGRPPGNALHKYFLEQNSFKKTPWMNPTLVRIGRKTNIFNKADKSDEIFLSFCFMLNGKKNNDPAYVDLNAIPEGASSALVIDRSVFGEHMVMPNVIDKVFKKELEGDVVKSHQNMKPKPIYFEKKSSYSFWNKDEINFEKADFRSGLTYGLFNIADILSMFFSWKHSYGNIHPKKAIVAIEEDHISFGVKDIQYHYSIENHPKITQNYIININYDKENKKIKAVAILEGTDFKYFHSDLLNLVWPNLLARMKWTQANAIYDNKEKKDRLGYYVKQFLLTDNERREFIEQYIANLEELNRDRAERIGIEMQREDIRLQGEAAELVEREAQLQRDEEQAIITAENARIAREQAAENERIAEEQAAENERNVEYLEKLKLFALELQKKTVLYQFDQVKLQKIKKDQEKLLKEKEKNELEAAKLKTKKDIENKLKDSIVFEDKKGKFKSISFAKAKEELDNSVTENLLDNSINVEQVIKKVMYKKAEPFNYSNNHQRNQISDQARQLSPINTRNPVRKSKIIQNAGKEIIQPGYIKVKNGDIEMTKKLETWTERLENKKI